MFEHVLETLNKIAMAYNHESGESIEVEVYVFPENMYSDELKTPAGKVIFFNSVVWKFFTYAKTLSSVGTYPTLTLYVEDSKEEDSNSMLSFSALHISVSNEDDNMVVIVHSDGFPLAHGLRDQFKENEYKEKIKKLLQEIFEKQLLSLDARN